ncbi:MAG: phenylacetate--CoA ligase [Blastochloris sp.]|nr:phenylacetate--CoA ligase [Blastochloris sp.]
MIWNREIETLPRSLLQDLQLERLRWSIRWAYERVPFHRKQFDTAGSTPDSLTTLDDLRRFPFMLKSHLREHYPDGLFAVPKSEIVRIHASSGTKGKPTIVGYTREDIDVWAEVCARSLACGGATPESVVHVAYGYGLFTGGLGMHYGAEKLGALTVPVSGGNTPRQITLLQDLQADVLCCTPSYALNLAETMYQRGIDPATLQLHAGIFGAEPWTEGLRDQIEEKLNLKALDIYGLSEVIGPGVSMESIEDQHGLFIWEDHFYPEIIDPASGEVLPYGEEGELVFTSLTKRAFPVIRYRTGDISTLFVEPSKSGRTMVRMERVKGRNDDMLIIRGVNVFPSEIERVLLQQEELAPHYQIVLSRETALDQITIRTELTPHLYADFSNNLDNPAIQHITNRVREELEGALGINPAVEIWAPTTILRSEGKAVRVLDQRG